MMIDRVLLDEFKNQGVVVIPGFYDVATQIAPIHEGVRRIVALVAQKHGIAAPCETPEDAMARGYSALIKHDRALGGVVYDAVKQIPEFMALVAASRNLDLFLALRPGATPGIAGGGYGIRIDNPQEERFRAFWHQEFPAQFRSLDGVVFWSPLLEVTPEMGPVELAPGSHREGLVPVSVDDGGADKTGAYALRLSNEQDLLARYKKIAPLTKPGDLIAIDFLTLHQSGQNISSRPRWSMQFRYFNFADPIGQSINWTGGFAQGKSLDHIFGLLNQVSEPRS